MKIFIWTFAFLVAAVPVMADDRADILREKLGYLKDIPEVAWVEFDSNNVYLGWKSIPADFNMINRTAAMNGNHAISFGVHVWSVKSEQKGWRPGDGPYLCVSAVRGGRIRDSSCK